MDEDDYSINTNCIVADYINFRIQKEGINWQTSPTRNNPNNKVTTTTRKLCVEFEARYGKQFTEMCSTCGEVQFDRENYMAVLDHLIGDGLNWGRVVAIFTFAGALSVHCMRSGDNREYVDLVREWTCSFIHTKVESWINKNNGWKGLVDFYTNGKEETEKKSTWGNLILGGALGAVALGAFIVNRA